MSSLDYFRQAGGKTRRFVERANDLMPAGKINKQNFLLFSLERNFLCIFLWDCGVVDMFRHMTNIFLKK